MSRKLGKEWKIGLLVAIAIALLILGLKFMMGSNIFSSENGYYTYYDNVQGLQESANVEVSGMSVGHVSKIELQPDRRVKVSFTTKKDLKIPKGSFAKLASSDLISGSKFINLQFSDSNVYYTENALIPSKDYAGILDNLSANVSPLLTSVQHAVVTLDTLISSVNTLFTVQMQTHLNNSIASLDESLGQLAELSKSLNKQSGALTGILQNTNSITSNLANNNENITQSITNLKDFSGKLSSAKIDETLSSLQRTSENLHAITEKINGNKGTLGMMLNDKKLYDNLSESLSSLDALLLDLKKHPSKYINVSVFGRKAK